MHAECEKYQGRLRELCEGSADLPLYKINAYRERWGLTPFSEQDVPVRPQPSPRAVAVKVRPAWPEVKLQRKPPRIKLAAHSGGCGGCGGTRHSSMNRAKLVPDGHGPGSQLLKLWTGMPHCDACLALAGQMDAWGVDGCTRRLDWIVTDILPRAQAWMKKKHPWVEGLLAATATEAPILRVGITRDVKRAIRMAAESVPTGQKGPDLV